MYGWSGKILAINLTDRTHTTIQPPKEIYEKWIGGKGLSGHYLRPHITKKWHDPAMPIILMSGPLVGTPSPTSGRIAVMTRSPLTGTIGDASVGGSIGFQLKKAGWDGIIITGKSDITTGVEIVNGAVKFTSVPELRYEKVPSITGQLKGRGAVAVTGPAAEHGVLFANVVVDGHYFAGRNGIGTVWASKNLKYITVKGTGSIEIRDRESLKKARDDIFRLSSASPVLMGELGITNFGTGALYDLMDNRRMMPTENFRKTHFDNAFYMNANAYQQKFDTRKTGCNGCHIVCKKVVVQGSSIPEFETMSHFSALINNKDIDAVMRANEICNEYGMDTISAGATLACYSEIEEKSLTPDEFLKVLEQIAMRKGIGNQLADGSFRYAASNGRSEISMSVKKQELPAYDPRGAYGMALAYAFSTRGGCHLRAYPISHEILRKPVVTDRFTFSGKARIIKISEDMNAVIDSLTACKFVFFAASLEEYARAYSAATGVESSAQDLLKAGERIYYHERIMNSLNGFDLADDDLPKRFFKEGGSSGDGITILPLNREEFLQARQDYYNIRGLDSDGKPKEDKAKELDVAWNS